MSNITAIPNCETESEGLAFMEQFPDSFFRIGFFDPQYRGVLDKLSYGNEGARQTERVKLRQMSDEEILSFIQRLSDIIKPSGYLFLWIDKFHLCEGISKWLRGSMFSAVDLITWDKTVIGMGYRTRRRAEYLLVLQNAPTVAKSSWRSHSISDCWTEKKKTDLHPHQKPAGLIKALVESTTNPEEFIIDPAAGSFAVLDVCQETGRIFYGCDTAVE